MKIPVLAAFALLALVGVIDADADIDDESIDDINERRLQKGWYPDKDPNPDDCGWKVFEKYGKCFKIKLGATSDELLWRNCTIE